LDEEISPLWWMRRFSPVVDRETSVGQMGERDSPVADGETFLWRRDLSPVGEEKSLLWQMRRPLPCGGWVSHVADGCPLWQMGWQMGRTRSCGG